MSRLTKLTAGIAFGATLIGGIASSALAATDGSLGVNSTGSSDITLEIADRVQISDVENVGLGAWAGSGNMVASTDFCVYRSGGDDYKLTLTTDEGAFSVRSATTTDSIAFSVKVDDDLNASDGESMTYNSASAVALAGSSSLTCSGSDNAQLEVTFAEAALQAASTANDYDATMTIFVEPI
jgi:hypothetical protein